MRRGAALLVENALCAFYATEGSVDEEALKIFTQKHLPYYSVPEKWVKVDSIPLTNNGKVDRKILRELASAQPSHTPKSEKPTETLKPNTVSVNVETYSSGGSSTASLKDPEKMAVIITSGDSEGTSSSVDLAEKLPEALPPKNSYHGLRWVRHRGLILYRRFLSVVILANIGVAVFLLHRRIGQNRDILANLSLATAANLVVAVLMRSEPVVNLLFTVFCSVPVSNRCISWTYEMMTDCNSQYTDLLSSSYTTPVRSNLPHWWYPQRMCNGSHNVAFYIHH